MPKKTINDYTFYKIINVNCDVDLCYVGSSVDMKQRTRQHKSNCNYVNGPKYNLKVYKTIREHGGWDEFKMVRIGYAEQLTLTEAHVIEEKYRVELCAELNHKRCFTSKEDVKADRRGYSKNNKVKISERWAEYYKNNKVKIKENQQKTAICECGCEIIIRGLPNHRKTKKHINLMNNKNNIDVIHNE